MERCQGRALPKPVSRELSSGQVPVETEGLHTFFGQRKLKRNVGSEGTRPERDRSRHRRLKMRWKMWDVAWEMGPKGLRVLREIMGKPRMVVHG